MKSLPGTWAAALFFLAILRILLLLSAADDYLIAHTLSDDSFYYLQIAKRAWNGGVFPSFDGINLTNGFHFLYQLLLIPLSPIFSDGLLTTYRVVIAINSLFFLGGSGFFWQVLKRHFSPDSAVACLAFLLLGNFPFKIVNTGLEASTAFFLSSAFLWAVFCVRAKPSHLGALLGLLILARLDVGAFYALFLGMWMLWKRSYADLMTVAAMAALCYLPVVVFNVATFGHIGTISQNTKIFATFSHAVDANGHFSLVAYLKLVAKAVVIYAKQIGGNTLGDVITYPYVLLSGQAPSMSRMGEVFRFLFSRGALWAAILGGLGALTFFLSRVLPATKERPSANWPLLGFLVGVPCLHFFSVVFLLSWHGGIWYWLPLTVAVAVASLPWGRHVLLYLALTGILYLPTLFFQAGVVKEDYKEVSWYTGPIDVADFVNRELPESAIVGCYNAGLFGFLSNRPVVNLDGLVNNWELLEARQEGKVREYIMRYHIGYLSDFGRWDKYLPEIGFSEDEVELLFQSQRSDGYLIRLKPVVAP